VLSTIMNTMRTAATRMLTTSDEFTRLMQELSVILFVQGVQITCILWANKTFTMQGYFAVILDSSRTLQCNFRLLS